MQPLDFDVMILPPFMNERLVLVSQGPWRGGRPRAAAFDGGTQPRKRVSVYIARLHIPLVQWKLHKNILLQKQMGVDSETWASDNAPCSVRVLKLTVKLVLVYFKFRASHRSGKTGEWQFGVIVRVFLEGFSLFASRRRWAGPRHGGVLRQWPEGRVRGGHWPGESTLLDSCYRVEVMLSFRSRKDAGQIRRQF